MGTAPSKPEAAAEPSQPSEPAGSLPNKQVAALKGQAGGSDGKPKRPGKQPTRSKSTMSSYNIKRRPFRRSSSTMPNTAKLSPTRGSKRGTFLGAIDQGTTSTRFLIFDETGDPRASHQVEFKQIYPHSGWIEHDPYELLDSVHDCINRATQQFEEKGYVLDDIKAVGLTNQRETTVVWDSTTGKPLYNAIVWPDMRTSRLVHELRKKEGSDKLNELCGLSLSTYPSSVKLVWMLRHVPAVQAAQKAGRLCFGTIDSWLLFNLTGGIDNGGVYVTDPSNASRTMLMNIRTCEYDDYLIDWFGVKGVKFPKIVPSADPEAYGKLCAGPLEGVRIGGCMGDQSSALVGQCAFNAGMAKATYGTGCFLLYNTGYEPVISKNGLLTTVGFSFKGMKPVYALEGSVASAGSAVKFLKDNWGMIKSSSEIGDYAAKVKDSGGVIFVTAFSGLFAPYWIDDARGTIFGITQYTTRNHICRATIEATCFQTRAILESMERDSGKSLCALAVDGGMSNSDVAMQIQSDVMGLEIDRPQMRETTGLGAAIAAGFAIGLWKNFEELKNINGEERTTFAPQIDESTRERHYRLWKKAVDGCRGWVDNDLEDSKPDYAEIEG